MKKLTFSTFALILYFTIFGQIGPKDVEIILTVNTDAIDKKNVASNVSLSDNSNNDSGFGSAANFTVVVYEDHKVTWKAKPQAGSPDKVKIRRIRKKFFGGQANVLVKKKCRDGDGDGVVVSLARSDWDPDNDVEVYWIKFKVRKEGSEKSDKYKLDPKIQIKPK